MEQEMTPRLEQMLRDAAAAEKLLQHREALHRERPRLPPEPNPYLPLFPGFFLWEKVVFAGMSSAAEASFQAFWWFSVQRI